jgi:hypothetical protein
MIDAMIGSVTRLKIYIEKHKFVKTGYAIGMTWCYLKVNPERRLVWTLGERKIHSRKTPKEA